MHKSLTRPLFRADFKERSRSANSKIQQSASTSEGRPAASCCERLLAKSSATADLQVPNRKQRRASLSASIGDHGDQELAARRSAPARPPIKRRSPSRKCQSAHPPQPPLGQRIRSARAEPSHSSAPAPPDRNRWPRRRPRAHEETRSKSVTRPPFRADLRAVALGQCQIQQSASASEGCPAASCCERLLPKAPPPPIAKSQTENSGGPRRRPASATTATRNWPRAVRRPHAHRSSADHPA